MTMSIKYCGHLVIQGTERKILNIKGYSNELYPLTKKCIIQIQKSNIVKFFYSKFLLDLLLNLFTTY